MNDQLNAGGRRIYNIGGHGSVNPALAGSLN